MWDESNETWTLPTLNTRKGNRLRERQTSGGSGRRPESGFSREMKLVDSNPRWRSEDIVDLDLVMPVRKSPASRDDPNTIEAIAAILAISMNDEVEELPLNEIRKNRKNKYLKAVSRVAFVCVSYHVSPPFVNANFTKSVSHSYSQSSSKQKQRRRKDKAKSRPTTAAL